MQGTDQDQPSIARRALSGGVLLLIGVIMLAVAWDYPVGRLTQMGPGFIPRIIGFVICVLAIAIIAMDVTAPTVARVGKTHWRGLIFVSVGILIFAAFVDVVGLVPSMFLAVAVSMFADDDARPLSVVVYASLTTFGGWLLFLVALELPIPAFWR
ncbi:tripartite tricarboxylate transporter TctB family protein [Roseicitreum antarcticum]|uniref:Tripartite tricarboxylate transporter TctB family protein n=1 Tax=Roseicitreum antarcticum TaxID=564137 RepID=A0A1H2W3D0_9RHOB|nr:tripartite tricarboxylate transporter TctB family protein [Roseicitreum antarcticum]SDW75113.1 Tripartite tricarboxylate transporter TctB family protein [Roseicitreum antarcticum]